MSYAIAHPVAARRGCVASGALRTLLLSLLMLVAQSVGADPVLADNELQTAEDYHAQLVQLHAIALTQLQAGQANGAAFTFAMEQTKSHYLSLRLARVEGQNVDTFQRGLYSDGAAQQQAIAHADAAKQLAAALEGYFSTLVAQPTSQTDLAMADAAMASLSAQLVELEQAMIDSQQ